MKANYNFTTENKFVLKNKKKVINQWFTNLQEELSRDNHYDQNTDQAFSSAILHCLLKQGENNFNSRISALIIQIEMHYEQFSILSSLLEKLLGKLKYFGSTLKKIEIKDLNINISNTLENLSIVKRYLFKISTICIQSSNHINELLKFTQTINDCLITMPVINSKLEYLKAFKEVERNFENIDEYNELFMVDFLKSYDNLQVISRNALDISDLSQNMSELLKKTSKCTDKESKKVLETCSIIKKTSEEIKSEAKLIEELIDISSCFSSKLLSSLNWNF